MKKIIFSLSLFVWVVAQAQNNVLAGEASQVQTDLSELFSRQFVLPDNYSMNMFEADWYYIVNASGKIEITRCDVPLNTIKKTIVLKSAKDISDSDVTKLEFNDADRYDAYRRGVYDTQKNVLIEDGIATLTHHQSLYDKDKAIGSLSPVTSHSEVEDLYAKMREWVIANEELLLHQSLEVNTTATPQRVHVAYSPLYYAQNRDTLYCNGNLINDFAMNEEAAMFYDFYVRNHKETPYYAVVRRNNTKLTLNFYDTATRKKFAVVNYQIQDVCNIVKTGNIFYLADDEKTIRIRQTWQKDSLVYSEIYDSLKMPIAKYEFRYLADNAYPLIATKELVYPSGTIKMRVTYNANKISTQAFNEDASKAKYTPAKGAEKVMNDYFSKNFRLPFVSKDMSNVISILISFDANCYISEKGELIMNPNTIMDVEWSCKYSVMDNYIGEKLPEVITQTYMPYLYAFLKEAGNRQLLCKPALMNGSPVESAITVSVDYWFRP